MRLIPLDGLLGHGKGQLFSPGRFFRRKSKKVVAFCDYVCYTVVIRKREVLKVLLDQREKKTVYLRLRCTEVERDRVKEEAKKRGMTVSKLLAVALDAYLENGKK